MSVSMDKHDQNICIDKVVGFEANNQSLHFGEVGAEHTDSPYMTLIPSGESEGLHISVEDFDLFAWSMTNVLGGSFDEFSDYELSYLEWNNILREARKIIAFAAFDDLFDYMVAKTACGLSYMNGSGCSFWKNKGNYLTQLDDVEKWTKLTMSKDGDMKIYGF